MNTFLNFLCAAAVAILYLSHVISGFNIPQLAPLTPEKEKTAETLATQLRDIHVVKDIRAFIIQHPNLNLTRLIKKEPRTTSQTVKYTLGNRVSGDRMVGQYADTFFYPAKKDVTTQVTYPETGTGSVVTAVDINCLQDNNDGNAYVVAGGIGQRFISVVLEATQTERFSYNVHMYGSN